MSSLLLILLAAIVAVECGHPLHEEAEQLEERRCRCTRWDTVQAMGGSFKRCGASSCGQELEELEALAERSFEERSLEERSLEERRLEERGMEEMEKLDER